MRKYTLGDTLLGMVRSLFNGTGMNQGATMREIRAAHDERQRRQQFGTGAPGAGGDRSWEPPFHATTRDGRPVTVSFGRGSRTGQTLICDGHVDFHTFYNDKKTRVVKGHDHYLKDGSFGADREKYHG